jgi:hypothetical protein
VGPPPDQAHLHRLGVVSPIDLPLTTQCQSALNKFQLYFIRPGDDMPIIPVPSPVLERAGLLTEEDKKADPKTAVRGYGTCLLFFTAGFLDSSFGRLDPSSRGGASTSFAQMRW